MEGRELRCRDCGASVAWRVAKSGKKYLAQKKEWFGEERMTSRCYWPAHRCVPVVGWREEMEKQEATRIAEAMVAGRIEKGTTVKVVKGRKVAIGTVGRVFWLATEEDGYGVMKAGIILEDGTKAFLNVENLAVATVQEVK